jgi:hypothetical protein
MLFSADLIARVLGHRWHPAVVLLAGMAGALGLQQVGYNWFSFYRARGESAPQAVESAVLVVAFGGLAIPGLIAWGTWGFVAGRVLTSVAVLLVRWRYIRALLPGISPRAIAAPALGVTLAAAVPVLAVRLALWGGGRSLAQVVLELALWGGGLVLWGWLFERGLLRELLGYLRGEPPAAPAVEQPSTSGFAA